MGLRDASASKNQDRIKNVELYTHFRNLETHEPGGRTRSSPGREKETGVEPGRGDGEGGEVSSLVGQDNRP